MLINKTKYIRITNIIYVLSLVKGVKGFARLYLSVVIGVGMYPIYLLCYTFFKFILVF